MPRRFKEASHWKGSNPDSQAEQLKSLEYATSLSACPMATGFRIRGKRWTIGIVRELFLGTTKFSEMMKGAPGINPRMLSLRLKELEEHQIVVRRVSSTTPVSIDYTLTDSGKDLVPVMFEMASYSMRNFPEKVFQDGKSRTFEQVIREKSVRSK